MSTRFPCMLMIWVLAAAAPAAERPNVLIIAIDDLNDQPPYAGHMSFDTTANLLKLPKTN